MRTSAFILVALSVFVSAAHASSWFASDHPSAPSEWTTDQYTRAQKTFQNVKDTTFDTWSESRLREFLLEQGIVEPSGPREQLLLLAKAHYKAYTDAAASFSAASTSAYNSASESVSSAIAQATKDVVRQIDDTKDYVYSTWDHNMMRDYLVEKGVLESGEEKKRGELLQLMNTAYASVANPVWKAWSDSYMREWLLAHGVIKTEQQAKRDALLDQMNKYYYHVTDTVYSTWSDSELKSWLVARGLMKSDAEVKREKLIKMVGDNYASATDTIWSSWSDSDIRHWLIENGFLKSDAKVKRDELVKSIDALYTDASARTAAYLTWPDARLRVYLRERGLPENALPTGRPGLLQETRIRWIQTQNRAEAVYNKLREVINGGVEAAEEKLGQILEILTGSAEDAKKGAEGYLKTGQEKYADEKVKVGEGMKKAGQKVEGEL